MSSSSRQSIQGQIQHTIRRLDRAIGDRYSEARALYRLGDCAADEAQWADALAAYHQAGFNP